MKTAAALGLLQVTDNTKIKIKQIKTMENQIKTYPTNYYTVNESNQPRPQGAFSFRFGGRPCVKVRSPGNEDANPMIFNTDKERSWTRNVN